MQGDNCVMIYSPDESKILFCLRQREPYLGLYNLVGGHIEQGESGEAAAYRELYEETGITAGSVTLAHLMDFNYFLAGCRVEVWAGRLKSDVRLVPEAHPLFWLPADEDMFSLDRFAGEGNIGHMAEQVKLSMRELKELGAF